MKLANCPICYGEASIYEKQKDGLVYEISIGCNDCNFNSRGVNAINSLGTNKKEDIENAEILAREKWNRLVMRINDSKMT